MWRVKGEWGKKSHFCILWWKLSTVGDVLMTFDYFLTGSRIIYFSSNWDSVNEFYILGKQNKECVIFLNEKGNRYWAG